MSDTDALRDPNSNWLQRWSEQNIGWHHLEFNPHLLNHWQALHMPKGSLVLAPFWASTSSRCAAKSVLPN